MDLLELDGALLCWMPNNLHSIALYHRLSLSSNAYFLKAWSLTVQDNNLFYFFSLKEMVVYSWELRGQDVIVKPLSCACFKSRVPPTSFHSSTLVFEVNFFPLLNFPLSQQLFSVYLRWFSFSFSPSLPLFVVRPYAPMKPPSILGPCNYVSVMYI